MSSLISRRYANYIAESKRFDKCSVKKDAKKPRVQQPSCSL